MYQLSHYWEREDWSQEFEKIIGFFATEEQGEATLARYQQLPGFQEKSKRWEGLDEEDDSDFLDDTGFFLGEVNEAHRGWEEGFSSYEHYSNPAIVGAAAAEAETTYMIDIPYHARNASLLPNEDNQAFAHRLMQAQGLQYYPQGPTSEFWELRKWALAMQHPTDTIGHMLMATDLPLAKRMALYKKWAASHISKEYSYKLLHYDPEENDLLMISTYFTYEDAAKQVPIYQQGKGFRDLPESFYIDAYPVGKAYWQSGYATKALKVKE